MTEKDLEQESLSEQAKKLSKEFLDYHNFAEWRKVELWDLEVFNMVFKFCAKKIQDAENQDIIRCMGCNTMKPAQGFRCARCIEEKIQDAKESVGERELAKYKMGIKYGLEQAKKTQIKIGSEFIQVYSEDLVNAKLQQVRVETTKEIFAEIQEIIWNWGKEFEASINVHAFEEIKAKFLPPLRVQAEKEVDKNVEIPRGKKN